MIFNHTDLPSARSLLVWFNQNPPYHTPQPWYFLLVIFYPLTSPNTVLLGYKFPLLLVAFRVESNVSPLLQDTIAGVPTPGTEAKKSSCDAGDRGLIPRSGRSPGEVNGYGLQYSCLGSPMDRGAWGATNPLQGVTRVRDSLATKPPPSPTPITAAPPGERTPYQLQQVSWIYFSLACTTGSCWCKRIREWTELSPHLADFQLKAEQHSWPHLGQLYCNWLADLEAFKISNLFCKQQKLPIPTRRSHVSQMGFMPASSGWWSWSRTHWELKA